MPDIWMDINTALAEVPVNIVPLVSDSDFKTIQSAVAYNAAGLSLRMNFVTTNGTFSQFSITPTSGGLHDWTIQGGGMYTIEIPTTPGDFTNTAAGVGWFTGVATGVLAWRGPTIGFRNSVINDALIDDTLNVIADAILARDIGSGSGAGSLNERTVRSALRLLRNKTSVAAGTLTVRKEDDSTSAWTAAVTTTVGANPITDVDPA